MGSSKLFKTIGIGTCIIGASEVLTAVGQGQMIAKMHEKDSAKADEMLAEIEGKDGYKNKLIAKTAKKLIKDQK